MTYEEIFEAGIQAALAQREPVAYGELKRYGISCNGELEVHHLGPVVSFSDWQRTEAARLAAERMMERAQELATHYEGAYLKSADECDTLRDELTALKSAK